MKIVKGSYDYCCSQNENLIMLKFSFSKLKAFVLPWYLRFGLDIMFVQLSYNAHTGQLWKLKC